jgi:hypothetical protein
MDDGAGVFRRLLIISASHPPLPVKVLAAQAEQIMALTERNTELQACCTPATPATLCCPPADFWCAVAPTLLFLTPPSPPPRPAPSSLGIAEGRSRGAAHCPRAPRSLPNLGTSSPATGRGPIPSDGVRAASSFGSSVPEARPPARALHTTRGAGGPSPAAGYCATPTWQYDMLSCAAMQWHATPRPRIPLARRRWLLARRRPAARPSPESVLLGVRADTRAEAQFSELAHDTRQHTLPSESNISPVRFTPLRLHARYPVTPCDPVSLVNTHACVGFVHLARDPA